MSETWRYERYNDPEVNFALHIVDVDAGEDGRPQDYGTQIASGWWTGDDQALWMLTASPVMLNALLAIRNALSPNLYHQCPETARLVHGICNRAIQEATTDPNRPDDAHDEEGNNPSVHFLD